MLLSSFEMKESSVKNGMLNRIDNLVRRDDGVDAVKGSENSKVKYVSMLLLFKYNVCDWVEGGDGGVDLERP